MTTYTQTFSTSLVENPKLVRSGTGIGTRFYYSMGGTPETWREEPSRINLSISDSITGRTRIMTALIANPRNTKDSIYTPYIRVKLVEYLTGLTIFLGRVEFSDTIWDKDYGQILKLEARDYSYELFERKVSSDYSGAAHKRSELITHLVEDYRYNSSSITTNIEASGSSQTIYRNYTKSGKLPIELIEELAKEDPWDDTPTGYGYDYYVDDNQVFQYFKRGSKPAGGPSANGLTVAFAEAQTTSKRAMMPGYNFTAQASEIVTRVTVYGTDKDGTAVSVTRPASLPSALETSLGVIKAKDEFVWGAEMTNAQLTTYCTNRADALINYKASESLIRGDFKIARYPYYGAAGSETLVRVGDLIHIHCSTQSINDDFLVLEVKYEEPSSIANIKVVSSTKGRSYSPFETASILQGLRSGTDVVISSAKISDLIVGSAMIGSLDASKITTGDIATDRISANAANAVNGGAINISAAKINISGLTTFSSGYDPSTKIVSGGAAADVNGGVTTISGGKITTGTLAADRITSGTVTSATITIGTSGYIKSANYSAGSAGWQIDYAGNAEFNNVTIRGTINQATIGSGQTVTVSGTISGGGGAITMDSTGLKVNSNVSTSAFKFMYSGAQKGIIYCDSSADIWVASDGGSIRLADNTYITGNLGYTSGALTQYSSVQNTMYDILPFGSGSPWIGSSVNKWAAGYFTSLPSCPQGMPSVKASNGLSILRKIGKPKYDSVQKGYYLKDMDAPEEMKVPVYEKKPIEEEVKSGIGIKKIKRITGVEVIDTGTKEIDYIKTIGVLTQASTEILEKLDELEERLSKLESK